MNLKRPKFIFGTQYWRPPMPVREDWERDLDLIKETGLIAIKLFLITELLNLKWE